MKLIFNDGVVATVTTAVYTINEQVAMLAQDSEGNIYEAAFTRRAKDESAGPLNMLYSVKSGSRFVVDVE